MYRGASDMRDRRVALFASITAYNATVAEMGRLVQNRSTPSGPAREHYLGKGVYD